MAQIAKMDNLVISLRLESGEFLSELRMPIPTTEKDRKRAVERWLDFMATGFRLSAEKMDAVFSPPDLEGGQ
jgi:DNA polymerase IIIc chi subunit